MQCHAAALPWRARSGRALWGALEAATAQKQFEMNELAVRSLTMQDERELPDHGLTGALHTADEGIPLGAPAHPVLMSCPDL